MVERGVVKLALHLDAPGARHAELDVDGAAREEGRGGRDGAVPGQQDVRASEPRNLSAETLGAAAEVLPRDRLNVELREGAADVGKQLALVPHGALAAREEELEGARRGRLAAARSGCGPLDLLLAEARRAKY